MSEGLEGDEGGDPDCGTVGVQSDVQAVVVEADLEQQVGLGKRLESF